MDVQSAANLNIPEGGVRNIHDKDKRLLWSAVGYNVRYDGNTTQQTYSGKNQMPMQSADLVNYRLQNFVIALPAGTYTYSFDLDSFDLGTNSSFSIYSQLYLSNGTWKDNNISSPIDNNTSLGRKSYTFTLDTDVIIDLNHKSNIRIPQTQYDNGARASISNIMIEPGSTATTYEPYVGGIPAPNPDYPQAVNVVTGAQTVEITGKNLASIKTSSTLPSVGGLPFVVQDGIIKINGESSSSSSFYFDSFKTNSGSAVFWMEITGYTDKPSGNGSIILQTSDDNSSWSTLAELGMASSYTHLRSVTLDSSKYYRVRFYVNSNTFTNATIKFQLEYGASATTFQPYQGQTFPVDLGSTELCKFGNYQDYIFKSSGKNLVDAIDSTWQTNNATLTKTDGIFRMTAVSGKIARAVLPLTGLIEGETYTISFDALGVSVGSDNLTYLRVREEASGGDWVGNGVGIDVSSGYVRYSTTFVATSVSNPWAWFYLSASASNTNNVNIYVKNIQLEKSSTATPYEPYGTDWCVHKDMGKVILDGTGTWNPYTYYPAEYTYMHNVTGARSGYRTSICSHFTNVDGAWQDGVGQPGYYSDHPTLGRKYFVSDKTTVSDFTTWLSTHNVLLRYALENPTDTKITDSTLIGQLNAIHDWLRRYDYYGVASGNLPIIIDRTGII